MSHKALSAGALRHFADYQSNRWFVVLEPGVSFDDLFVPTFWAHHAKKLNDRPGNSDQIRVRAHDGAFDVMLTVVSSQTGGVSVELWPKYPSASVSAKPEEAAEKARLLSEDVRLNVVPLAADGKPKARVEWLAATKFRCIGLNGEIGRDFANEASAEKALEKYMIENGLRFPTEDETKAMLATAEAARVKIAAQRKPKAA